jgi:RelE toxin of RelE / RelB toxin-antitoxin system
LTIIRQWRIMGQVELIETSAFTRQITALLSDEEYGAFQSRLAANPGLGALIKGGGGIRKIRVAVGSRGKRGGARVIYYWALRRDVILLLYAYAKNVSADLTPKQAAQLAKVVKQEFRDEAEIV